MKTYRIFVCFDSRTSQSGWISVERYKRQVMPATRFENGADMHTKVITIKSDLITKGATHFKVYMP